MIIELTNEQKMLKNEMQRFCKKELTPEYVAWMDENVDFPPQELWDKFNEIGYFRAGIPVEYGGDGLSLVDMMLIQEPVCKASMSVAMAMGVNHAFGGPFIKHLGTEEMKREFLPKFAEGKLKTCMALTEPAGGTDILGALSTYAVEKEDRWVINGEKVFITCAHVADYMIVICKTEESEVPSKSLSIFIVPAKSKGITITKIPKISCHHCDSVGITFKHVEIPKGNLLGTRGRGWYQLINVLNPERIVVALMGVGLMEAIYDECLAYVKQRHAFGGPIGRFQILQKYLADMAINIENAKNLTYKAAWLCDHGRPYHMESNMAKVVAAEGAMHAGIYGAEIFGGYGICMEYPIQRYLRDSFQIQFSPISNEMARNMIMQFQGLPKSWA
jgi:acyl-CoA dehydrogenase